MNYLFLETLGYESALRISGHHYARLLARKGAERGDRVVSFSTPISPLHRLVKRSAPLQKRMEHHATGLCKLNGGVLHGVPFTWLPVKKAPILGTVALANLASFTWRREIIEQLQKLDFKPDIIFIQNPMFYPLLQDYPDSRVIYRMVDLMRGFNDIPPSMLHFERKLVEQRADLIVLSAAMFESEVLESRLDRVVVANNAVDAEFFATPRSRPECFAQITRPIVLYIGAMRAWFDWDLMIQAAQEVPDADFVLVSPDAPNPEFTRLPNAYYIPGVAYEEIPALYQHAALTVIPFKSSALIEPLNPIKAFESFAAGTPVVSVAHPEMVRMEMPIDAVQHRSDFSNVIRRILAEPTPENRRAELKAYAAGHSWSARLDAILRKLDEVNGLV